PATGHVGDAGNPDNGASTADGAFVMTYPQSMATIIDGSSGTAAASEQLIGFANGTVTIMMGTASGLQDVRRYAAFTTTIPLPDAGLNVGCNNAIAGWRLDRGYAWWDGDYRSGLYNHYLTPNSKVYDCWQNSSSHDPAIKAARSLHP